MTNGIFCDIHKDANSSLVRVSKNSKAISYYTLTLEHRLSEPDQQGKKVTWTYEVKLHACPKCTQERIIDYAKGLGVELEPSSVYRLTKDANGKFKRINKFDVPVKEEEPIEA